MARRLIESLAVDYPVLREAKIYRDAEWDEYRVVFYIDGKKQSGSGYHTSDKADALQTAGSWVNAYSKAFEVLKALISDGIEYPDAESTVTRNFAIYGVTADMLRAMYDAE